MTTVYDFSAARIDGDEQSLRDYQGQVLLIVNTASECGFTPQYEGLQELYQTYKSKGLTVLGFPCNQFGGQEPGSNEEVASFCTRRFAVTFPMFGKIEVNGAAAHPLYRYLTSEKPGIFSTEAIKWNFTKFLVNRHGDVVGRYAPTTKPAEMVEDIERLLAE